MGQKKRSNIFLFIFGQGLIWGINASFYTLFEHHCQFQNLAVLYLVIISYAYLAKS